MAECPPDHYPHPSTRICEHCEVLCDPVHGKMHDCRTLCSDYYSKMVVSTSTALAITKSGGLSELSGSGIYIQHSFIMLFFCSLAVLIVALVLLCHKRAHKGKCTRYEDENVQSDKKETHHVKVLHVWQQVIETISCRTCKRSTKENHTADVFVAYDIAQDDESRKPFINRDSCLKKYNHPESEPDTWQELNYPSITTSVDVHLMNNVIHTDAPSQASDCIKRYTETVKGLYGTTNSIHPDPVYSIDSCESLREPLLLGHTTLEHHHKISSITQQSGVNHEPYEANRQAVADITTPKMVNCDSGYSSSPRESSDEIQHSVQASNLSLRSSSQNYEITAHDVQDRDAQSDSDLAWNDVMQLYNVLEAQLFRFPWIVGCMISSDKVRVVMDMDGHEDMDEAEARRGLDVYIPQNLQQYLSLTQEGAKVVLCSRDLVTSEEDSAYGSIRLID